MGIVNSKLMVFFWIYVHGLKEFYKILRQKVEVKFFFLDLLDVSENLLKALVSLLWIFIRPLLLLLSPIWIPILWLIAPIPEAWRCTFRPKDKRILAENIEKIKRGEY